MPTLINKILFGTSQAETEGDSLPPEWRRFLFWGGAFVLLAIGRICLPFRPCESQDLYDAIGWALLNEQNWGKQAVAGVLEYAPLPAVVQLLVTPLELLRQVGIPMVPAGHLVIAIAQVWILFLLVRAAQLFFSKGVGVVVGSLLFLIATLGTSMPGQTGLQGLYFLAGSPFWICAVPLVGVIYHLLRWERDSKIRDIVVASLYCGVLVFCGLAGIAFAGSVLVLLIIRGRIPKGKWRGIVLLLLMPFVYALLLLFLFNYLVMGDVLFAFRRLAAYFGPGRFWAAVGREARIFWVVGVSLAAVIGMAAPGISLRNRLAWQLAAALGICHVLQHGGNIFIGGAYLFGGLAALPTLLSIAALPKEKKMIGASIQASLGVMVIFAVVQLRQDLLLPETYKDSGAPSRQELIAYVDQQWKDSRILVYGLRPAVMYARVGPEEAELGKRFVARVDFNRNVLMEDIQAEQLHLLVPPDNGRYYPRHHQIFSQVHQDSVPEWLLLEKTWVSKRGGGGYWELWRCVRARPEPTTQ